MKIHWLSEFWDWFKIVAPMFMIVGVIFASFFLALDIGNLPGAPPERHHAVVRQCTPCDGGWAVVCSPEVGGSVLVVDKVYREPGQALYVGVVGAGWRIVSRPE